mmetsp:Transcript_41490/g.66711  ORF Transcript_41490/g.66711 Transcript_41490/m.66711 type:complete len:160 (-) Transcript_41490:95-574(-)
MKQLLCLKSLVQSSSFSFPSFSCFSSIPSSSSSSPADSTVVLAYTPLQPATSAILSFVIIQCGFHGDLEEPGYNILGLIGIIMGLTLLFFGLRKDRSEETRERCLSSTMQASASEHILVNGVYDDLHNSSHHRRKGSFLNTSFHDVSSGGSHDYRRLNS